MTIFQQAYRLVSMIGLEAATPQKTYAMMVILSTVAHCNH